MRQYLDSSKEGDKLRGMKWLLAMMSKGRDVSEFFPDVCVARQFVRAAASSGGSKWMTDGVAMQTRWFDAAGG